VPVGENPVKTPLPAPDPSPSGPRQYLWALLVLVLIGYLATWPARARWAREREERALRERAGPTASEPGGTALAQARAEIAALQRGLRGGPGDAALYVRMAALYESLGEREPAFQALLAARQAAPGDAEVATALAAAHEMRREFDLAIEEWQRALRLGVTGTATPVALSALYVRLGWSREAETLLAQTRRRAPEEVGVRITLGMLHVQNGRLREAEAELKAAKRLAPDEDRIESLLANLYELTSRREAALAAVRRALGRRPDEPDYLVQLGGLLLQDAGERAAIAAEAAFRSAVARAPQDARGWSGLARALRRRGRPTEAAEILEPLCARRAADAATLREWGQVLAELGRREQSRDVLARAAARERESERLERAQTRVSIEPDQPAHRRTLGALYLAQGDAPRAIVELKRCLALRPKDAEARALLARALQSAGRTE
jgi:tetratricopeptide (TPR) repeat protein